MRVAAFVLTAIALWPVRVVLTAPQQDQVRPTFKSAVDMVAITAVVRDEDGHPVNNLKLDDFTLTDNGHARPITTVQSSESAINIGFLVDFSGSMDVAAKLGAAHEATAQILSWLEPGIDQVGLMTFDTRLHEVQPFAPAPGAVLAGLENSKPFGETSLYDALAGAGRVVAEHGGARRAVVALTDGDDNHSHLTPSQVSGVASSIDVPVYIVVVVSPYDRFGTSVVDEPALEASLRGPLGDVAHWTGGEIFAAVNPSAASQMARAIVTELRHEYLIAFEPGAEPGWHAIDVRTHKKNLIVRARSGYIVQGRTGRPQ
jgi:VWFA-related protein